MSAFDPFRTSSQRAAFDPIAGTRCCCSFDVMVTMHMPLKKPETAEWRPVEVTPLHDDVAGAVYRVEGPMPEGEDWEFGPGSIVQARWKKFGDGEHRLILAGSAPISIRSVFADHYKRTAGVLAGVLPWFVAMMWLPRAPEGHAQSVPLLLSGASMVLVSVCGLIWLKPQSLIGKSALRSGLGFGVLACLASLVTGK